MSVLGESSYIFNTDSAGKFRLPHARTYIIIILHMTTCVRETHKSSTAAVDIYYFIAQFLYDNILYILILRSVHGRKPFGIYAMIDVDGATICVFILVYGRYVWLDLSWTIFGVLKKHHAHINQPGRHSRRWWISDLTAF